MGSISWSGPHPACGDEVVSCAWGHEGLDQEGLVPLRQPMATLDQHAGHDETRHRVTGPRAGQRGHWGHYHTTSRTYS